MFVNRLVQAWDGECICLVTRPHWFRAIRQGFVGLALLLAGLTLLLYGEQAQQLIRSLLPNALALPRDGGDNSTLDPSTGPLPGFGLALSGVLAYCPIIFILAGAVMLGWALLDRHFTEFAITISPKTGGRIIKAQGILSRHTVMVPLVMVNNLVLYEPLLGRILGWGHVDIETGNDYQGDRLEYMPNPRDFYTTWATLLDIGYIDRGRVTHAPSIRLYADEKSGAGTSIENIRPGHE